MNVQQKQFVAAKNVSALFLALAVVLTAHALLGLGLFAKTQYAFVTKERKSDVEIMLHPVASVSTKPIKKFITPPIFDSFFPPSSKPFFNLSDCKPDYPKSALLKGEEGVTRIRFKITADGDLVSATILKSSGHAVLDQTAVEALSKCTFFARMKNGTPVQSTLVTDYVWSID